MGRRLVAQWAGGRLCPGLELLLRPDLLIVVTVGGPVSRALRVGFADGLAATIDTAPPTARELRIEAEQERLDNPLLPRGGVRPGPALPAQSRLCPVALSPSRCWEAVGDSPADHQSTRLPVAQRAQRSSKEDETGPEKKPRPALPILCPVFPAPPRSEASVTTMKRSGQSRKLQPGTDHPAGAGVVATLSNCSAAGRIGNKSPPGSTGTFGNAAAAFLSPACAAACMISSAAYWKNVRS